MRSHSFFLFICCCVVNFYFVIFVNSRQEFKYKYLLNSNRTSCAEDFLKRSNYASPVVGSTMNQAIKVIYLSFFQHWVA